MNSLTSVQITNRKPFDFHRQPTYPSRPQRLNRRKSVTMAAGFCCSDGVVLCAETQLTHPEGLKENQSKLRKFEDGLVVAMTGAGTWDYMEMAFEKITDDLRRNGTQDLEGLQDAVESNILNIYNNHIAAYPYEPKPGFSLIFGTWTNGKPTIIKSSDTAVSRSDSFVCFGTGAVLGKYVADLFYSKDISIHRGAILAAYMVWVAKGHVDGCSGRSEIMVVKRDGEASDSYEFDPVAMEADFTRFDAAIRSLRFSCRDWETSDEEFKIELQKFNKAVKAIRDERLLTSDFRRFFGGY